MWAGDGWAAQHACFILSELCNCKPDPPPGNPSRSCVGWIGILIYMRGLCYVIRWY